MLGTRASGLGAIAAAQFDKALNTNSLTRQCVDTHDVPRRMDIETLQTCFTADAGTGEVL